MIGLRKGAGGAASRGIPAAPDGPWRAAALFGYVLPMAGSLWHILERTTPVDIQEAGYLNTSYQLWALLASGKPLEFIWAFCHAMHVKAPLVTVLPVPFYLLLGPGLAQALLANLAALGAASLYAYRIGRFLDSPRSGALAVWCLNLTPLVFGISRLLYVETLLTATVAGFFYYLLRGGGRVQLGVLLGLGMLSKINFPLYVFFPACLLAGRGRGRRDWIWIVGIGTAIAAGWYAFNLPAALSFAWRSSFGEVAERFSAGTGPASWARYAVVLMSECWGWNHVVLAAAAAAVVVSFRAGPRPRRDWRTIGAFLGWGLLPFLVLGCSENRQWRYALPALAGASVALGVLLGAATRDLGRWRALAAGFLLIWPGKVFWEQTVGRGLPLGPGAGRPVRAWVCNGPRDQGDQWGQEELLLTIAREAGKTPGVKKVVSGIVNEFFNSGTAQSFATVNAWPLRFFSIGPARTPAEAMGIIAKVRAEFVVCLAETPAAPLRGAPPDRRRHDREVYESLAAHALPYRIWFRRRLPNGATAAVFRRVEGGPLRRGRPRQGPM